MTFWTWFDFFFFFFFLVNYNELKYRIGQTRIEWNGIFLDFTWAKSRGGGGLYMVIIAFLVI
jgi:hypothetical protein